MSYSLPIVTTPTLPGRDIAEALGIVSTQAAFGMNVLKDIASAWRDFIGGRAGSLQNILADTRKAVLAELANEAKTLGADAVIGIDLDLSEFREGMVMMIATGTAVRLAAGHVEVEAVETTIRRSLDAWSDGRPPASILKVLDEIDAKRRQATVKAVLAHACAPLHAQARVVSAALAEVHSKIRSGMTINEQKTLLQPQRDQIVELEQANDPAVERWQAFRAAIDALKPFADKDTWRAEITQANFARLIEATDAAVALAVHLQAEFADLS